MSNLEERKEVKEKRHMLPEKVKKDVARFE